MRREIVRNMIILMRTAHVYWFLTRVVKANLLINNQGRRKRAHTTMYNMSIYLLGILVRAIRSYLNK